MTAMSGRMLSSITHSEEHRCKHSQLFGPQCFCFSLLRVKKDWFHDIRCVRLEIDADVTSRDSAHQQVLVISL